MFTLDWIRRFFLSVIAVLLCSNGPQIFSMGLVNIGNLIVRKELEAAQLTLPLRCESKLETSNAREYAYRAMHIDKGNLRVWNLLGHISQLEGDCQLARDFWQHGSALSPLDEVAKLNLANTLLVGTDESQAIRIYRELDSALYLYYSGRKVLGEKGINTAIRFYELANKVDSHPVIMKALAESYRSVGRFEDASEILRRLLNLLDSDAADYWWATGYLADINGLSHNAIESYAKGLLVSEDGEAEYDFHWQIAGICMKNQDYTCAYTHYYAAWEIRPLRIRPLISLGNIARIEQNYKEALGWYERAERVFPQSELPEYYEGLVYLEQDQFFEARSLFEASIQQNPENSDAAYHLAQTSFALGDISNAIRQLEKAVNRVGDKSSIWSWILQLAKWYEEYGRCQDAIELYEIYFLVLENHVDVQNRIQMVESNCP